MQRARRRFLTLLGSLAASLGGCSGRGGRTATSPTASPTPTTPPASPIDGGAVEAAVGETARIPIRLTNTASTTVPAGNTVLRTDVGQFLPVERRGTGPRDGWGTFEGTTFWQTPEALEPGATTRTVLPVAASTGGLYTFVLEGVNFPAGVDGGATGEAQLRVGSVPSTPSLFVTIASLVPSGRAPADPRRTPKVLCPGTEYVLTAYVQNGGQRRSDETTLSLSVPWGDTWSTTVDTPGPGRYLRHRFEVPVPADVETDTTGDVTLTATTGGEFMTLTTERVVVDGATCRREVTDLRPLRHP